MAYAIIKVINGNFSIDSEGYASADAAKVKYHDVCKILWSAPDVITACVAIADEDLMVLPDYKETITHPAE